MKILSIACLSLLILLTACKEDENPTTMCTTKATLTAKGFECYGLGIVTEHGDTLIAVSNLDQGHACPLAHAAQHMNEGDEFRMTYELNEPGVICMIAPPAGYGQKPEVWITCLTVPCENGEEDCMSIYQK